MSPRFRRPFCNRMNAGRSTLSLSPRIFRCGDPDIGQTLDLIYEPLSRGGLFTQLDLSHIIRTAALYPKGSPTVVVEGMAMSPIEVTLSGMVMEVRLLQFRKALSPMEVTPSGMVMEVSVSQEVNAYSPIVLTLSGMVMVCRLLLP